MASIPNRPKPPQPDMSVNLEFAIPAWAAFAPGLATARWWKEERGESVFVDFNQNAKDRTVASAYSVRPLPDARVTYKRTEAMIPMRDGIKLGAIVYRPDWSDIC